MLASLFVPALLVASSAVANVVLPQHKARMIAVSDINNEPDDAQSFVRMLLYANEIEIEAMIATTSIWLPTGTFANQIFDVLDGYEQVLDNLQHHATALNPYPSADHLRSIVRSSFPSYGMAAVGDHKFDNNGTQIIIDTVDKVDPYNRPVHITLWGGSNSLAQALWLVKKYRSAADLAKFVSKIRVHAISDQDDSGPWIRANFPELSYVVSISAQNAYGVATWTGISGDDYYGFPGADTSLVTHEWFKANIQDIGPLGKHFPNFAYIAEGDSSSFMGLIPNGLNVPRDITFGGWGGRYGADIANSSVLTTVVDWAVSPVDGKVYKQAQATIWRWRSEYQNDFAGRMQWTVSRTANNPPSVIINNDDTWEPIRITAKAGTVTTIDASASVDSDGDKLSFEWSYYRDVGTYQFNMDLESPPLPMTGADTSKVSVTWPATTAVAFLYPDQRDFHIILKVTDSGTPALSRYRRVIVTVQNN